MNFGQFEFVEGLRVIIFVGNLKLVFPERNIFKLEDPFVIRFGLDRLTRLRVLQRNFQLIDRAKCFFIEKFTLDKFTLSKRHC